MAQATAAETPGDLGSGAEHGLLRYPIQEEWELGCL